MWIWLNFANTSPAVIYAYINIYVYTCTFAKKKKKNSALVAKQQPHFLIFQVTLREDWLLKLDFCGYWHKKSFLLGVLLSLSFRKMFIFFFKVNVLCKYFSILLIWWAIIWMTCWNHLITVMALGFFWTYSLIALILYAGWENNRINFIPNLAASSIIFFFFQF